MTRSLILAAHGELARSVKVAAGGTAMVLETLVASLMLGILGVMMLKGQSAEARRMQTSLRVTVLALTSLTAGVWIGAWAVAVTRSLKHG